VEERPLTWDEDGRLVPLDDAGERRWREAIVDNRLPPPDPIPPAPKRIHLRMFDTPNHLPTSMEISPGSLPAYIILVGAMVLTLWIIANWMTALVVASAFFALWQMLKNWR
jgi:hypothetical protein